MFIPFLSLRDTPQRSRRELARRKGGGGGGHGGGGHGGGGHSGTGSSGHGSSSVKGGSSSSGGSSGLNSGSGRSSGQPNFSSISRSDVFIASNGQVRKASPFGNGGGPTSTIPDHQPFAGRSVGGPLGTRTGIYGTHFYGSGYNDLKNTNRGVAGRNFPFVFWPVVFVAPAAGYGAAHLYSGIEYGKPNNSSRPGGPLEEVVFSANSTTLRVITDNSTAQYLFSAISNACTTSALRSYSPVPYNSSDSSYGRPEQAIQYYRASSVVVTLDGYNNTAALNGTEPAGLPTSLPSSIDTVLLNCVNQTIGSSTPLIGDAGGLNRPALLLIFLTWSIVQLFSL